MQISHVCLGIADEYYSLFILDSTILMYFAVSDKAKPYKVCLPLTVSIQVSDAEQVASWMHVLKVLCCRLNKRICHSVILSVILSFCNTGPIHGEISTDMCTYLKRRCTFQWIFQQSMMIEPCFDLNILLVASESLCSIRLYLPRKNV